MGEARKPGRGKRPTAGAPSRCGDSIRPNGGRRVDANRPARGEGAGGQRRPMRMSRTTTAKVERVERLHREQEARERLARGERRSPDRCRPTSGKPVLTVEPNRW